MGEILKQDFLLWLDAQVGYQGGSNHYNKYGVYFDTDKSKGGAWQYFNTRKKNADWCALVPQAGLCQLTKEYDLIRKSLGEPEPKNNCGASAHYLYNYMKKKGLIRSDKTKGEAGDIMFVNTVGTCSHVATIRSVDSKYHTIEGNRSNKVKKLTYTKNSSKIYAIGRIPYELYPDPAKEVVTVELDVLRYGMQGEQVKTVQRQLHMLGYKKANGKLIGVDGIFGDNTLYVVKAFQRDHGLVEDGIVGIKTWNMLLKGV